ncbi:MAG: 5'-methylthioadenosine/S-adenosylhomocysteine nucleosidase [Turicibacter sp.]|nr:5'-methylthioadenosine/S-adenosylhomocysteine nucleosidase [Turicibacter sp.]
MMAIAIIGAMEEEVQLLRGLINIAEVKEIAHVEFTVGTLEGREVVLLRSGIGKVNAAVATTLLFEHFDIEAVINTGSAGGLHPDANVGDVVVSNGVIYHDVDVTGFDYAHGQVPGMPKSFAPDDEMVKKAQGVLGQAGKTYWQGAIGTGDSFINRPDQLAQIMKNTPDAVAIEMEAAAVAQVCHIYAKPFVILRALSDIAGKESHITFPEFLAVAAKESSEMVRSLVAVI